MIVASVVRKAGKVALKAVGAEPDEADRDLLDTLRDEHDEIRSLLRDLERSESVQERRSLVRRLKATLVPHNRAEDEVLYAALIASYDVPSQMDGHEGSLEHDLALKALEKLDGITDATSTGHLGAAKVLRELMEHHIRDEESKVWRDARRLFSSEERMALNRRYLAHKTRWSP